MAHIIRRKIFVLQTFSNKSRIFKERRRGEVSANACFHWTPANNLDDYYMRNVSFNIRKVKL